MQAMHEREALAPARTRTKCMCGAWAIRSSQRARQLRAAIGCTSNKPAGSKRIDHNDPIGLGKQTNTSQEQPGLCGEVLRVLFYFRNSAKKTARLHLISSRVYLKALRMVTDLAARYLEAAIQAKNLDIQVPAHVKSDAAKLYNLHFALAFKARSLSSCRAGV